MIAQKLGGNQGVFVPSFLLSLIQQLDESSPSLYNTGNLFSVNIDQKTLEEAYALIQQGHGFEWRNTKRPAHTLANLIKLYLQELPEPVFTTQIALECCNGLSKLPTKPKRVSMLRRVIQDQIPQINRHVLYILTQMFQKVIAHANRNQMDASKLSYVFAPLLLGQHVNSVLARGCIELMITDQETVFAVPSSQNDHSPPPTMKQQSSVWSEFSSDNNDQTRARSTSAAQKLHQVGNMPIIPTRTKTSNSSTSTSTSTSSSTSTS
eukprot:CAMPEP_0201561998 /NCGR_PEP_ID=MMETSP0173_2-20130828/79092_1 /ASSEMBLY_ACC=CAM_ASM_000268 /TAXON_ID=218659 /ORGANISM="Vexillifera sp., Strain DIVA3 564/2" /LENGTH=264 /DNA_ID=CAMNT_0047976531 /DNA_START=506 /DNA_END=1297 /DNA_ORIENTATION=-